MSYNARHWLTNQPSMANVWRAQEEAEAGSTALLEALSRQYLAFAMKHGVTVRDAQLLLMNGVEPAIATPIKISRTHRAMFIPHNGKVKG